MPRHEQGREEDLGPLSRSDVDTLLRDAGAVMWQRELLTGRVRFVAPGIESMLGYPSQRWMSEPGFWESIVHPDERRAAKQRLRDLLEDPAGGVLVYQAIASNGQFVWLTDTVLAGTSSERTTRIGFTMQAPRHAPASVAASGSVDLYRSIVEACPRALMIHRDGVILFANTAATDLLGAAHSEDLHGRAVRDLVHPDFLDAAQTRARRVQEEGTPAATLEERARRLDGREIIVAVTSVPYTFRGERAVLSVAEDVTGRHHTEELQHLLASALEATREAIVLVRLRDGVIVEANRSWCELTGDSRDDIRGRPFASLRAIANPDEVGRLFEAVRTGRHVRDAWLTLQMPRDRYRHLQMAAERVIIGDEPHMLAHGSDMTEHLSLEQQQRQSQRMEALGRLAGGIAHDFNNLLTVISSFAQLAEEDLADGVAVVEALREIHRASFRAAELTRTLLSFSRGSQTARTILDVDPVIDELQRMLDRVIGTQVTLVHEPSETPALVSANRGELEQIIVNLVVNSRDAMPNGGTIRIRVHHLDVDRDEVFSPDGFAIPPGRYAHVEVSDTGTGIAGDAREHVFEPFFSTKPPGEGTGLGLSTAYGIVKQHGGHIWFDTTTGSGTTFHIVLPEADAD